MMEKEIIENHNRFLERVALYRKYGYDIEKERAFIIEKARPISGAILEAGTGKGYFTLALAREGFNFTSFDVSAAEQQYARLNLMYHSLEHQVHFDVADAEYLDYGNSYFDVIFAVNMIHHLSSVRKVCDEFIRILSLKGKIVLSDFNNKGFAILDKIHAYEGRRHEVGVGTMNEIKAKLIERGFVLKEYCSEIQDVLVASRISI
jgi:2-polyprenyl-3-methyl-5-hydroxy-6-metoxy-1,4-benzoquinol methylase